jgi:hypothetical protein
VHGKFVKYLLCASDMKSTKRNDNSWLIGCLRRAKMSCLNRCKAICSFHVVKIQHWWSLCDLYNNLIAFWGIFFVVWYWWMQERPKWLEIRSIAELKTKLGHVIVMILLVGMFEKSKKVPIHTINDLLCLSASILLASGSLFLLSKLHSNVQE